MKPIYLKSVVDSFVASEDAARNLCLTDLATQYYADYDNGDMVMPHEAQAAVDEAIETLSANRKLAMMNPRADKLTDASVAVDISRSSSNYATFATSIPFRQLVMNGLCRYTTTNVNNNSKSVNYYLLQVLETGAIPKYTVMAADADVLKNSAYSYYYDVQYAPMAEEIKSLYDLSHTIAAPLLEGKRYPWEALGEKGYISDDRGPQIGDHFHEGNISYHLRRGCHFLSRLDWLAYMSVIEEKMKK